MDVTTEGFSPIGWTALLTLLTIYNHLFTEKVIGHQKLGNHVNSNSPFTVYVLSLHLSDDKLTGQFDHQMLLSTIHVLQEKMMKLKKSEFATFHISLMTKRDKI